MGAETCREIGMELAKHFGATQVNRDMWVFSLRTLVFHVGHPCLHLTTPTTNLLTVLDSVMAPRPSTGDLSSIHTFEVGYPPHAMS